MRFSVSATFMLVVSFSMFSQELHLQRGVVQDSIKMPGFEGQTYALYLPENFSNDKKWPVVFVFDPAARAKEAIEVFKDAAENYGYVLASSNQVKNQAYQENFKYVGNLVDAVLKSFPIDENKLFTTGFSGGARLAAAAAVIEKRIKGVIACGASFATNTAYVPIQNTFVYIGVVGDEDFNLTEMQNGLDFLKKRKFDAQLMVFNGGHEWPPKEYAEKALRTLSLKMMQKGIFDKDDAEVKNFYLQDYGLNQSLIKNDLLLQAEEDLLNMMENYRFLEGTDSLKTKLRGLRRSDTYKFQKREEQRVEAAEALYREDYTVFLKEDVASGNLAPLGFWEEELKKLTEIAKNGKEADQKMVKRLKSTIAIATIEFSSAFTEKDHLNNLIFGNILLTMVYPENAPAYLQIIRLASKKGEYGMALYYLEELLKTGFKDVDELDALSDVGLLRISPEYNEILEKYGIKSRY